MSSLKINHCAENGACSRRTVEPGAKGQSGLSAIELCVTLALLAALAGATWPSLRSLYGGQLAKAASVLQAHLHLARSEAIKRGLRTAICKSADGRTCTTSGSWAQGWLVFEDANNNAQLDPTETVIQASGALPEDFIFTGNLTVNRYISFRPDGSPALVSGAFQAGTVSICQRSASATRGHSLIISATGRTRLQAESLTSCA